MSLALWLSTKFIAIKEIARPNEPSKSLPSKPFWHNAGSLAQLLWLGMTLFSKKASHEIEKHSSKTYDKTYDTLIFC